MRNAEAAKGIDLERLARDRCEVLKDEPAARVERIGTGRDTLVRKVYRNRGLRLLQTFLRRTRAEREHVNLLLAVERSLPCTPPVGYSAHRRLGFAHTSTLVTRNVPDTTTLKQALSANVNQPLRRRQLIVLLGELLRTAHDAGLLWCTAMPRNVIVQATATGPRLLLCDLPAAIIFPGKVPRATSLIDLFDACASKSRCREMSRPERFRSLLAYSQNDRSKTQQLWRDLARRHPLCQRARKNLVMALRTYILKAPRKSPTS
jgi:hypothetical protein